MSERIFLSRRNLLALLSKLDRKAAGDDTQCTIIKFQNPSDPFVQTMDSIAVTAVEDKDYYMTRNAGVMDPRDTPDVGTRDAPSPVKELNMGDLVGVRGQPFTGFEEGKKARHYFDLSTIDTSPDTKVTIVFPEDTYAISSSFFRGMFEKSIVTLADADLFYNKYNFKMSNESFQVLAGLVVRTLIQQRMFGDKQ